MTTTPAPTAADPGREGARGIRAVAALHPSRPALIDPDGRVTTFAELSAAVDRWSRWLLADGVQRDDVVALMLPNTAPALAAELGVLQLPLHSTPINRRLTIDEIAYILADSGARSLVVDAERAEDAAAAAARAGLTAEHVLVVGDDAPAGRAVAAELATMPDGPPDHLEAGQRMLYTSGTTGRPKGIRRALTGATPDQALAAADRRASEYGFDHWPGVHLATGPLYHAAPGAYAMQTLQLGHTVVILGPFDAERALAAIQDHGVTTAYMVPTMFSRLLALPSETRARYDTSTLRSVVHTAAPCPPHVKRQMIDWFGPVLVEIYGGSEGSATVVGSEEWLAHPGTVGRPRPGADVRILDDDRQPVPPNTPGNIYISNPSMRFEYFGDAQKTAAQSVDGYFTVGDIGYLDDDGYLFLCDRAADVIISGGVNIYPAEVDAVLLRHPAVADAATIGIPDDEWGETVLAVVAVADGIVPDDALTASLIEFCRANIASFKCPRRVEYRAELPRSEAGKILRRQLRDEHWAAAGRRL
jgi:long-chain acyl-CoA synthetase